MPPSGELLVGSAQLVAVEPFTARAGQLRLLAQNLRETLALSAAADMTVRKRVEGGKEEYQEEDVQDVGSGRSRGGGCRHLSFMS